MEVIDFLDEFFEAEKQIVENYLKPDLKTYNNSVDNISNYVVDSLKSSFGAKLSVPMSDSFYERMEKHPPVEKRYLFRIDHYNTEEGDDLYIAYVSNKNPKGWKAYFDCFIILPEGSSYKISAKFNFTDRGTGIKKWYFTGGEQKFLENKNGERLLNEDSLGERKEIKRLLEPSDDQDSIKEYNKDEI